MSRSGTGSSPRGRSADPRKVIKPLTTSLSGIPISGSVQGGGLYDFSAMRQARWSEFYNTQHSHSNLGYDYNFKNKFVGGAGTGSGTGFIGSTLQRARKDSSSASTVKDPTDTFKPHKAFTAIKGAGVSPRIRFIDTKRMRSKAQYIYNQANPGNINELDAVRRSDYSEIKQLRGGNSDTAVRSNKFKK